MHLRSESCTVVDPGGVKKSTEAETSVGYKDSDVSLAAAASLYCAWAACMCDTTLRHNVHVTLTTLPLRQIVYV